MKNLFVLMALAGIAAFQVGCGGDSAPAPAGKPGAGPAGGPKGMAGKAAMSGAGEGAKQTDVDKAKGEPAAADDAASAKAKDE